MIKSICIIGSGANSYNHFLCANFLNINVKYIYSRKINKKNTEKFTKIKKEIIFFNNVKLIEKLDVDAFIVSIDWRQNDNIISLFKFVKKPILFEKPLGAFNNNFLKLQYKNNKFIALNRRCYSISKEIKKILKNNTKYTVEIIISEKISSFKKRFSLPVKKILYFNSIHTIDLAIFYFGKLRKVFNFNKIFSNNSFKKSNYVFKDKKNNLISVWFFNDTPENNSIKIRFDDKTIYHQCPLEKLVVYRGINIKKNNLARIFIPKIIKKFEENSSGFKAGYLEQMKMFKNQNGNLSLNNYLDTLKLIKKLA